MKRQDLQDLTKKALQSLLELRSQKSSENRENGSRDIGELSSKEETHVEYSSSPSPWDEIDSVFIDFSGLY
jgi:dihydrodipicolinate reductase